MSRACKNKKEFAHRPNLYRLVLVFLSLVLPGLISGTLYAQGWYNGSWLYRKIITVDYTKVGTGPHTNYPMLVSTTDTDLKARALASGNDILFTLSDGTTKLNHEIESYTSGTGALVAWVEIPSLSSTANTVIFMYYGNAAAAAQQNVNGTWDSNFKGVWHLNGVFTDATSNANNGTNTGTTSATGKISGARGFVRSDGADYITITGLMSSPANLTLSGWGNLTSRDATGAHIINIGDYASICEDDVTDGLLGAFFNVGWGLAATHTTHSGAWHYFVYTFDDAANSQILYVDGVSSGTGSNAASISYSTQGTNTFIGKHANGNNNYDYDGTIDEVRVSNTVRSAGWILTDYNNQNSPSTFYAMGSEAKPYYSLTNGNSNTAATWSNTGHTGSAASTAPGGINGDYVAIGNNNSVTLNANITNQTAFDINSTGTLNMGTNTVTGAGTFSVNSGGTLGIGSTVGITTSGATGNVQVTGTRTFTTSANYTYNGSSAQVTGNALPTSVNNLTINNSAGVTLTAALTGCNDVSISSGTLTTNGFNITVSGNWSNSGTFTAGTGTVTFSGGNAQTFTQSGSGSFYNLTINKSANAVTLSSNMTVTNVLTLTALGITLGTNDLTIGSSGSISGGSSSSYIVTNSSGRLIQNNIGSGARTGGILFPIGTTTSSYTPITLTNASTADAFDVRVFDNVYKNGTSGTNVTADVVRKTWMVNEGVAGGSNVTLSVQWNGVDEGTGFSRTNCGLSHFTSSVWDTPVFAAASGSNPYTRSRSSITSFSPFAVEENTLPLPVTFLYFKGKPENKKITLTWATASERNNRGFQIEKSLDGIDFKLIGFVAGNGNSVQKLYYSFIDPENFTQASFYRLKQIDWDDQFEYSQIVYMSKPAAHVLNIYPNPITTSVQIEINEELTHETDIMMDVLACDGEIVMHYAGILGDALAILNEKLERWGGGLYFIQIRSQHHDYWQKFIKN